MWIAEVLLRQKDYYKYYSYIQIFTNTKHYYLISMDHTGSIFFLISSRGVNWLFYESGNSYTNNRNPTNTNLTSSHGSFQRLDKDLW